MGVKIVNITVPGSPPVTIAVDSAEVIDGRVVLRRKIGGGGRRPSLAEQIRAEHEGPAGRPAYPAGPKWETIVPPSSALVSWTEPREEDPAE